MLSSLELHGFKRFSHLELALSPLSVLSGLNGSGKSTVLQSLVLAHQASLSPDSTVSLSSETGLDLGHAADLLNHESASGEFSVKITSAVPYEWVFDIGPTGDVPYLSILNRPQTPPEVFQGAAFIHLAAERIGPRTTHPSAYFRPDDAVVGFDGRYAAHTLAVCGRNEVPASLRHESETEVWTLRSQVEAWLSDMVGPTQVEATLVPKTNLVTLRIRKQNFSSEWLLPTNTGFGVSYCLPIIVAGLTSKPGGILIVDSPEAHLHPAGQSAIGRFLATVAASGVQVLIETHSDHVINGIRRHVASGGETKANSVLFHFFGEMGVDSITVDEGGRLSRWPEGFFDQMDKDLFAITTARK
ncbi:DUF3696 domain-containing protein [Arthrobacter sp. CJ23]|uniref:AAA family ATPase n=1 Tax=Arthrobacter sp. CJ23 TaxID=2972479 RepID=UPI00215C6366|nr:DUF3696 domain-containing protein [Arthrobacter sp. CJ23]UVJ39016.1 DUF3696 domain-containing protein [Arthrobacter sp. CJ23]